MFKQKKPFLTLFLPLSVVSLLIGGIAGYGAGLTASNQSVSDELLSWVYAQDESDGVHIAVEEESAVVDTVEHAAPAVVSIIVTKDLPIYREYYRSPPGFEDSPFVVPQIEQEGTEQQEVGGGSGFIVSSDGYIVTNRHVVSEEDAEYSVVLNNDESYEATVLDRDPVNDIAVLKIEAENLPVLTFGDSDRLQLGQTTIAIGNALGEFSNTVSKGIVSGLSRSIVAGGAGLSSERLTNLIQTDAAINVGNSGGPLLNIAGQVIGMSTAVAGGAQSIGFAIPSNEIKTVVDSVREHGEIVRPWLGVRYMLLNDMAAQELHVSITQGAYIIESDAANAPSIIPGSPAEDAGLEAGNIILEVNDETITQDQPLASVLRQYAPGETVTLMVYDEGDEREVEVTLEEFPE